MNDFETKIAGGAMLIGFVLVCIGVYIVFGLGFATIAAGCVVFGFGWLAAGITRGKS